MPSQEIGVGGLWSPTNSRMSAAKYSGTGAQAASANSARSPAANACTNFIGSSEIAGTRRIFVLRPSLCREYDRGNFVPAEKTFRQIKTPSRKGLTTEAGFCARYTQGGLIRAL